MVLRFGGQITAEIGDQRMIVNAGGLAFTARGTVHTFQNFAAATAQMLVMVTPGGFNVCRFATRCEGRIR